METRTFVRLCKLQDITYSGDTADARAAWIANVLGTVGEDGYTLSTTEDGSEDTADFACEDLTFEQVSVYDFAGSAYEQERFYARDIVTFKHKVTGEYYVLNAEDLWEF